MGLDPPRIVGWRIVVYGAKQDAILSNTRLSNRSELQRERRITLSEQSKKRLDTVIESSPSYYLWDDDEDDVSQTSPPPTKMKHEQESDYKDFFSLLLLPDYYTLRVHPVCIISTIRIVVDLALSRKNYWRPTIYETSHKL